jgi:hypothetical protein
MITYVKTLLDGREQYVNDILVDLPDQNGKDFDIVVEGRTFTLSPQDAHEFCMDYSRDGYSQTIIGGSSAENLSTIEHRCGYVQERSATL